MSVGSLQAEIPPAVGVETSGTLDKNVTNHLESSNTSESSKQDSSTADHVEQALESHEVIELQAFSKRKEWIVGKIKFLENMPPIELFVGLDAIRTSADIIPGLPTRAELQQWLVEHDKIEKETELFDSGELKKFKQFTKATAKRNLSPEDTDLIELTLTTIYEFDKLLHLLRDRSENLDLLGVRLTWEEQRAAAWAERRKLLADLQAFLSGRSRWSPAVYETVGKPEEPSPSPSHRRGSIMSVASDSSYSSSPGFSRSARFILAEALSKDAAQFAGRISSLRHTKISAAGKALDKLIDHSRKPVPEEFLDEQDRLEDHGINELENVGKFVMDIVTQWRKADEFYVETVKDQAAARMLYEEIETAKLSHPSARQDTLYTSRASAIGRRLLSRKNPAVSNNGFPKPSHPLFPDQKESNKHITQLLQSELTAAIDQARKVEQSAQDYHAAFETVKRVEVLCSSARALSERYSSILDRLQNGTSATDGDGTPPDLSTHQCLDPTQHSTFLALLPSLLREAQEADDEAKALIPKARAALLGTSEIQVDPIFRSDSLAAVDTLASLMTTINGVREDVASRVSLLRDARKLWSSAEVIVRELELVRGSADESMQRNHWRHQSTSTASGQPLTPESPRSPSISSSMSTEIALETLAQLEVKLSQEVLTRFSSLTISPAAELRTYMSQSFEGLSITLSQVKRFIHLSESIQQQALVMSGVQSEMHDLQLRLEVLKDGFEQLTDSVLDDQMSVESLNETELKLAEDAQVLQDAVQEFSSGLPHRVLFVAPASQGTFLPVKRRFSVTGNVTLDSLKSNSQLELPFDLSSLDDAVRTDCNAFSLNLTGAISSLERKRQYLRAAHLAKDVDEQLQVLMKDVHSAAEEVETLRSRLRDRTHDLESYASLLADTSRLFDSRRPEIARSFSPIRELLRNIDALPRVWDMASDKGLLVGRIHAVDDAELEFKALFEGLSSLKSQILDMRRTEELRIEEQRLLAQRLEEQRLEAERLEAQRLEEQRLEQERLEQERLEQARLEQGRFEQERLEQERLEQERLEEQRCEEQRLEAQQLEDKRLEEQRLVEKPRSEALQAAELKQQVEDKSSYDVFGLRVAPETGPIELSPELRELQHRIRTLRSRLLSMNINAAVRPTTSADAALPTRAQSAMMRADFSALAEDVSSLPTSVLTSSSSIDVELRSLRTEMDDSERLLRRLHELASLAQAVQECDPALSDFLEHIDSYPAPPLRQLSSTHISQENLPPEEQLQARMLFTKDLIDTMDACYAVVMDDSRASSERRRVLQTWNELESMASDRMSGRKSRPPSSISMGRTSRASIGGQRPILRKKSSHYSVLSVGSSSQNPSTMRGPSHPSSSTRRTVSHNEEAAAPHPRASSRMSVASSTRSVSGPIHSSSRLYQSTFASRQRTTSLSTNDSPARSPVPASPHVARPRTRTNTQASQMSRVGSPTPSNASSHSRSFGGRLPRTSLSHSTFGRAPRLSFPTSQRSSTPQHKIHSPRKKPYVANPQNKLDMAVGDVVNNLPVDINIEVVEDTWRDQSGKYWIGEEEPKLCFCRILRSQTVMVRVGGGWMELSKFIKTHFADMFRVLPETVPNFGSREEKWITSTTLLEAPEIITTPPLPPRTPERGTPVPSFLLSSPSGRSPQSIKSTSSPGSPLTPLQFMRRAEPDGPGLRPVTPSKGPLRHQRSIISHNNTQSRGPVWKP